MRDFQDQSPAGTYIEGRNAVTEALRAGTALDKLYIARGETDHTLGRIAAQARKSGVVVVECDRRKLDAMSETHSHQGVIAVAAAQAYAAVEDILQRAADRGEPPLVVVCDEISDPHNLGAIIRTAECAGAHGVIIPKRRSAGLTAVVAKTSAGAVSHVPVARVANLTSCLKELKAAGVWVYGTASDSGKPAIQTQGLQDFGLPELGFFDPQREVGELLDLLYSMSCLQITGKQLYRNMALIPLDEKTEVVCKQEGGTLFFIGA